MKTPTLYEQDQDTYNFYQETEVEDELENDEISAQEEGFMLGYLATI